MAGFMKSALNLFGIGKEGASSPASSMELEEFLKEVAKFSGYDLSFSKKSSDAEGTTYDIIGDEAEEFLGPNSEMLEALAHLSMRFQRRKTGLSNEAGTTDGQEFRIRFDSGDFRDRKIQELRDLAANKRDKVKENNGKPTYINALGPAERKVIHTFITETGDMVSESIGSGYFKRIRIRLKDDRRPEGAAANGAPREGNREGNRGDNHRRGGQQNRGGPRGGRPQNNNNNNNRGPRQFNRSGGNAFKGEPNGNVVPREVEHNEVDDNIGNRLAPGESPAFSFNDSHDSDRN